jgi:hypothetical protein
MLRGDKTMTHWLHLGGMKLSCTEEQKQWDNLNKYIKTHKNCKATVYNKTTGDMFCRIVKLECNQNYNKLNLDCNSMSIGSIRHLNSRPNNIELCKMQLDYFVNRNWGVGA